MHFDLHLFPVTLVARIVDEDVVLRVLWIIAPHASSLRCDQSVCFVGICRFDFRDWSFRWFLDIFLIPIQKSSGWSLSKVELTITKLLQKSWRFFTVRTAKGVVDAWTWCFGYALFRSVFCLGWWCFLVRVSDFSCKTNTPGLMRVRSRRFHCAVCDPFTICSWFYWWLILEFNDVFPRVSEEMIFNKYELKPYVLCFSLQYWTPCLSSLLGLFGSFCCYSMVLFREWSSRCFLDLLLVPITVASKSFCWYLIVLFREWSCWWFLDILLIHIIVALELLASFQSCSCGTCVFAWICCFWYVFFREVLVSVDDAFWSVFLISDANLTHLI